MGNPAGGILDVPAHRALGRTLISRRDDVEQFLVAVGVLTQLVRRERLRRRAIEVDGPAAHLRRDLDQQGVVGQFPQALVELLVEFVQADQIVLVGCEQHVVDDCLQPGVSLGRKEVLQLPDDELLEHYAQAGDFLQNPRREAGDPRPAPRQAYDEALLGQPRQRLAQRDVTDAELLGQAPFDQAVTR